MTRKVQIKQENLNDPYNSLSTLSKKDFNL